MSIPSPIYLYRIIHIDNLQYILNKGALTCPSHSEADKKYIGIGDDTLKEHRKEKTILLKPNGTFSDYVAFYFGRRAPMLYNIKNGFQGVTKRCQDKIIYIVTSFEKIQELKVPYVFFDGHGYHHLSQPFNNEKGLTNIDWKIVNAGSWNDTELDPDRKRRKQAEILMYNSLQINAIIGIATYSDESKIQVEKIINNNNIDLKTIAKPDWFY